MCAALSYHGEMTGTPAGKLTTDAVRAPGDRLTDDLGWGLAVVFRAYVRAADAVTDGDDQTT